MCCYIGIDTNDVWERHFLKRYGQMAVRKRYFVWREHHVADPICDTYQAQYLQNHCSELLVSLWTVGKCRTSFTGLGSSLTLNFGGKLYGIFAKGGEKIES
jgi:hypothetical protein